MKILPPSSEIDRCRYKQRLENALARMHGGDWRVDIILGRYGWYVRAVRLPVRHRGRNRVRKEPNLVNDLLDAAQSQPL